MKKRTHKKRRSGKAFIIFAFILIALCSKSFAKADKGQEANTITYTISQGETLWTIARKYTPSGKDVRQTIYEIEELNKMDNAYIYAGQQIQIKIDL